MTNETVSQELTQYATIFSDQESESLAMLNEQTHEKVHGAQMLSGALQAAFLRMLTHLIKPKNVLELGTYTGYSALCFAEGIQDGGLVHTIDTDASLQNMRDEFWEQAGMKDKIVQHIGMAIEIIPTLEMPFDLVFIDADKGNYVNYFNQLIEFLPIGACILADNVLFHGEVVLPLEQQSKNAQAVHAFNEVVFKSDRVERVIVPIRDGVSIIRKIK